MTLVKVNNPANNVFGYSPLHSFSKLLADDFPSFFGGMEAHGLRSPAANIKETEQAYEIHLSVPGWQKSDFSVAVEKSVLSVSAKKETSDEQFQRREFGTASFKRSFTLPEIADTENITAKYDNGILLLTIAKKEQAAPSKKEIEIQ